MIRLVVASFLLAAFVHASEPDPENVKLITDDSAEMQDRDAAVKMLAKTAAGAQVMLKLAEKGQLPDELKSSAALALAESEDESIRAQAAQSIPLPKMKGGEQIESISKLKAMTGDPKAGRAVFENSKGPNCINCHQIDGKGKEVGPPLNTIGEKPKEALYESILAPSAQIQHGFEAWSVKTDDGKVLSGLKVDDSDEKFTMKTTEGEFIDIPAEHIRRKVKQKASLMPENLIQTMTKKDLIDLVEFLSTQKVP